MNWVNACLRLVGIRSHRTFRLTLRCIALVCGLCAAFWVSVLLEQGKFDKALNVYLLIIAFAVLELVVADVLVDRSFPFDTERKLAVMEEQLGQAVISTISDHLKNVINKFQGCDNNQISACVHVFVELTATSDQRVRKGLLQLTDYVGLRGGKKGRITLITQGVIGRCARTDEMETADFADARHYVDAMVRDFGFTHSETERHTKTGRSYLAFPLHHEEQIVGVLYFFSTESQVFPRAGKRETLEDAAREIVNYVKLLRIV